MKKIIALVAVAAVSISMVCAEIGLTVGAKGNFGMNAGPAVTDSAKKMVKDGKNVFMVNGGGAVYARYNMPFHAPLGVQMEIGIRANNGGGLKVDDYSMKMSYTTMDIPLLVTYDIPVSSLVITPMLGLNFGIPVGKGKWTTKTPFGEGSSKVEVTGLPKVKAGIVVGADVALPLGPGSLTGGLSYIADFSEIGVLIPYENSPSDLQAVEVLTRRNLNISVGYAIKL